METFTQRNMAEHWREIRISWESDVVVHTSEDGSSGGEGGCGSADSMRLFPDGLKEVSIAEFCADMRAVGREDILEAGTRGAIKERK